MRRLLLFWVLSSGLAAGVARGADADWLTGVFPERAYDFGNVARGSQIRHAFLLVESDQCRHPDRRLADQVRLHGGPGRRRVIPPGTQTTVEATINTTNFQGHKASGLTLILDRPNWVEVDLNLTVLHPRGHHDEPRPGRLRDRPPLGQAPLGLADADLRRGPVRLGHRQDEDPDRPGQGRGQGDQPDRRRPDQLVHHGDAPAPVPNGYFKDEITLVTNDTPPQTIPLSVVANIQTAVSVTPSIINLGPVRPGQTVSSTNVVHVRSADAPFTITKLTAARPEARAGRAEARARSRITS